jgi:ribulose-bisphosphate carboxylase small chain
MRITQGTFSFLPDLRDEQIAAQVQYALDNGWAISFEHTNDPHPRNTYWELDGLPLFDVADASVVMRALAEVRERHAGEYIRLSAYDSRYCRQTTALSFIVQRPAVEPELRLDRTEGPGRTERFALRTTR